MAPEPTEPISTCRLDLSHLLRNEFSGRDERLRAIVWTVATHGIRTIASGSSRSAIIPGRRLGEMPGGAGCDRSSEKRVGTTTSPQFTSQHPPRQLASAFGPAPGQSRKGRMSRIPQGPDSRKSGPSNDSACEPRRSPPFIASPSRGVSLHLEQRLCADDRALVGECVKRLDRQVVDTRDNEDVADRFRGQAIRRLKAVKQAVARSV